MSKKWSWPIFFDRFWVGYGRMMAVFTLLYLLAPLFADTSSADFESAMIGLLFAAILSAIYGYSEGDAAVRDWRAKE